MRSYKIKTKEESMQKNIRLEFTSFKNILSMNRIDSPEWPNFGGRYELLLNAHRAIA